MSVLPSFFDVTKLNKCGIFSVKLRNIYVYTRSGGVESRESGNRLMPRSRFDSRSTKNAGQTQAELQAELKSRVESRVEADTNQDKQSKQASEHSHKNTTTRQDALSLFRQDEQKVDPQGAADGRFSRAIGAQTSPPRYEAVAWPQPRINSVINAQI